MKHACVWQAVFSACDPLPSVQTTFDYILIETTGLADPGPVAAALWTDVEIEAGMRCNCCFSIKCDEFSAPVFKDSIQSGFELKSARRTGSFRINTVDSQCCAKI